MAGLPKMWQYRSGWFTPVPIKD